MPKPENIQDSIRSVGSVIWWHIEGDHLRSDIDALAQQHKIKELKKRARASFTNALNEINRGEKGIVTRKIRDDFTILVYVLADVKNKRGAREMELGDQSWVAFDKMQNHVTWREADRRTKAFAERFHWYQEHYTHGDIRAMVEREISKTGTIPLRSTGGVYFAPEGKMARIEEVNEFLVGLGNDSHISMVSIRDEKGRQSIQRDFEQGAKMTLDSMLKTMDTALSEDGGLDPTKRNRMIRDLAKVRDDAESMKMLIQFKSGKLDKALAKVNKQLLKAVALGE